ERVVEPPEVAGEGAERRPQGDREDHGGDADGDGHAATPEHPGEHVATEVIGAERVCKRRALDRASEVDAVDRRGVDERAERRGEDQDDQRHHSRHRERVPPELVPRVLPERPRWPHHVHRRGHWHLPNVRGGGHYAYLILGSRTAYITSAIRLKRTTRTANRNTIAATTGVSLSLIERMSSSPIPGTRKICSVTIAPANTAGTPRATSVTTGMRLLRRT